MTTEIYEFLCGNCGGAERLVQLMSECTDYLKNWQPLAECTRIFRDNTQDSHLVAFCCVQDSPNLARWLVSHGCSCSLIALFMAARHRSNRDIMQMFKDKGMLQEAMEKCCAAGLYQYAAILIRWAVWNGEEDVLYSIRGLLESDANNREAFGCRVSMYHLTLVAFADTCLGMNSDVLTTFCSDRILNVLSSCIGGDANLWEVLYASLKVRPSLSTVWSAMSYSQQSDICSISEVRSTVAEFGSAALLRWTNTVK